jgi:hypothetical protein
MPAIEGSPDITLGSVCPINDSGTEERTFGRFRCRRGSVPAALDPHPVADLGPHRQDERSAKQFAADTAAGT